MKDNVFNDLITFGSINKVETNNYLLPFVINAKSKIFKGHFPAQPIMPGVVMIELVKRAAEIVVNTKIDMISATNFKFLKMLIPYEHKEALLYFSVFKKENCWKVKAKISINNVIYFKSDATFKPRA